MATPLRLLMLEDNPYDAELVLHALRHPTPLLNLALFRFPTFAFSLWGGLFFRISAGSIPFLLPVFLQVGLGMTAFVSGILIFADAIGNIGMNAVRPRLMTANA